MDMVAVWGGHHPWPSAGHGPKGKKIKKKRKEEMVKKKRNARRRDEETD